MDSVNSLKKLLSRHVQATESWGTNITVNSSWSRKLKVSMLHSSLEGSPAWVKLGDLNNKVTPSYICTHATMLQGQSAVFLWSLSWKGSPEKYAAGLTAAKVDWWACTVVIFQPVVHPSLKDRTPCFRPQIPAFRVVFFLRVVDTSSYTNTYLLLASLFWILFFW